MGQRSGDDAAAGQPERAFEHASGGGRRNREARARLHPARRAAAVPRQHRARLRAPARRTRARRLRCRPARLRGRSRAARSRARAASAGARGGGGTLDALAEPLGPRGRGRRFEREPHDTLASRRWHPEHRTSGVVGGRRVYADRVSGEPDPHERTRDRRRGCSGRRAAPAIRGAPARRVAAVAPPSLPEGAVFCPDGLALGPEGAAFAHAVVAITDDLHALAAAPPGDPRRERLRLDRGRGLAARADPRGGRPARHGLRRRPPPLSRGRAAAARPDGSPPATPCPPTASS